MKNTEYRYFPVTEDKAQTAVPTKKQPFGKYQPPEKTEATDITINTAKQTPGINQSKTISEDLQPLD